jgi:GT2 family glycosyltransferase
VSVVVPIYGRYDFIEYQMSLFADDPEWEGVELIYVVDDPRIGEDAIRLARQLHPLFRVSCRVITCLRNNGFSAACNIGAALTRGRLLLLLNSDVMPKRPGCLGDLTRAYDSAKEPGVVGAKLLFADGSVQHAGMTFHQFPSRPGLWFNVHPGKGLPNDADGAGTLVPVPAVTGACMMLERQLFLDVGGFDESYIIGDFEDSDLCLRLRERGRQCYVASSVELYHLERQSQSLAGSTEWRESLTLYNAWRQTDKWDTTIRGIVRAGS